METPRMPPPRIPPRPFTVDEVADLLGVHKRTLERRIAAGDVRVIHPTPGTVRIPYAEVLRLVGAVEDDEDEDEVDAEAADDLRTRAGASRMLPVDQPITVGLRERT